MFGTYKMGSYSVIGSNCQDFCNYFLEGMDAEQYMTTVEKASVGSSGIVAVVAGGVIALFAGSR